MKPFVTDNGQSLPVTDSNGAVVFMLPRYGAWIWDTRKRAYQCIECGDDAGALAFKYGVTSDPIPLGAQR